MAFWKQTITENKSYFFVNTPLKSDKEVCFAHW